MSDDTKDIKPNQAVEEKASQYPRANVENGEPKYELPPSSAGFNVVAAQDQPKQGIGSYQGKSGFGKSGSLTSLRYYSIRPDLVHNSLAEEVLLPKDLRSQHKLWRQIFLYDFIAGPALELWSSIPWSTFHLVGVEDAKKMEIYQDCVDELDLPSHLPWMTMEFLMLGKLCVHLLFDQKRGIWTDMIVHNPDYIKVTPVPLLGVNPLIDLMPDPDLIQFVNSRDPRLRHISRELNPRLRFSLSAGRSIPLNPDNTLYLPRKLNPYDSYGISMFMRMLDLVAFERAIMTASISVAYRRAGPLRVVRMGEDNWQPTPQELQDMAALVMSAEEDPAGSVVAVRKGVEFENQPNMGQDTWKISDEWNFLQEAKLKAMGLSETFISGEATYSTADMMLSVFLERVRTLRELITSKFIYDKVLIPIARVHKLYHIKEAHLAHRIRVAQNEADELDIPKVNWRKQLTPQGDQTYLQILADLEERGVPVTLKTWATAGALDLDTEMDQLEQDAEIRKKVQEWKERIKPKGEEEEAGGGFGPFGRLAASGNNHPSQFLMAANNGSIPIDKHPFFDKKKARFLDLNVSLVNDKIIPFLDKFDEKNSSDKKKALKAIQSTIKQLASRDRDIVNYMLRISGLPSEPVSDRGTQYLLEQLNNRWKGKTADSFYWQCLYSILGSREKAGKKITQKTAQNLSRMAKLMGNGLSQERVLQSGQVLTGVVKSGDILPQASETEGV